MADHRPVLLAFQGVLLAHQGGWDEFLLVAAPIVLLAILLWIANRRADAQAEKDAAGSETPVDDV